MAPSTRITMDYHVNKIYESIYQDICRFVSQGGSEQIAVDMIAELIVEFGGSFRAFDNLAEFRAQFLSRLRASQSPRFGPNSGALGGMVGTPDGMAVGGGTVIGAVQVGGGGTGGTGHGRSYAIVAAKDTTTPTKVRSILGGTKAPASGGRTPRNGPTTPGSGARRSMGTPSRNAKRGLVYDLDEGVEAQTPKSYSQSKKQRRLESADKHEKKRRVNDRSRRCNETRELISTDKDAFVLNIGVERITLREIGCDRHGKIT